MAAAASSFPPRGQAGRTFFGPLRAAGERVLPAQRVRKLSRVTISAAGRSWSGDGSAAGFGAGRLPTAFGSAVGGSANSKAKLTDGSAKLRIAAKGIVSRSNCFWKLSDTEND